MSELSKRVLMHEEEWRRNGFACGKYGHVSVNLANEVEALEGLLEVNLAETRIALNDMQTRINELESKLEWRPLTSDPASWPSNSELCLMRHSRSPFVYIWHDSRKSWFLSWATHWLPIPPMDK